MIYETSLRDLLKTCMPVLSDCGPGSVTDISGLTLQLLGEAIDYCSFCDGVVFSADPFHEPPEYYDTGISSCIVRDGHVEGMLLMRREDEHRIMPVLLFAAGDDVRRDIKELTAFTLEHALRSYTPDTLVAVPYVNDRIMDRLETFYGRYESKLMTSVFKTEQTDL